MFRGIITDDSGYISLDDIIILFVNEISQGNLSSKRNVLWLYIHNFTLMYLFYLKRLSVCFTNNRHWCFISYSYA